MSALGYVRRIGSISDTGLVCRCCGAKVYALPGAQESVCNFCEAYVGREDRDILHADSALQKSADAMQQGASQGKWADGAQGADALAARKDPYLMFGASSFYRLFSDFTYHDVDYGLGGFMHSNALKRSDESLKNKYNAVALISKSKEFLFKSMKLIKDNQQPDERMLFISFMSSMRLRRYVQAQKMLSEINSKSKNELMKSYANMVFNVERRGKLAEKFMSDSLSFGTSNSFYYLSLHLAMGKDLEKAIWILDKFIQAGNMPSAVYLRAKLQDFKSASSM